MRYKKLLVHALSLAVVSPVSVMAQTPVDANSPWSFEVKAGLGYDSNAYLAPSGSYPDVVKGVPANPVIHAGPFVPLAADAEYDGRGQRSSGFVGSYKVNGDFYLGSKLTNANELKQRIVAGMEFLLNKEGKKEDTVRVTPYFTSRDKTHFDRDTGDEIITAAGTDLSQRYSYKQFGIKGEWDHKTSHFPYSLHADLAQKDYIEPPKTTFDSYDHTYFKIGGKVKIQVATPSRLILSYDYSTRDYGDWRARDPATGAKVAGTNRTYAFNALGATLYNRISDSWSLFVDYDMTNRTDGYQGYSDYLQNGYGVRVIYHDGDKLRVKAKAYWWTRDYDKAFAFDVPGQASLSYDSAELLLKADYAWNKDSGPWGEFKNVATKSTDPRYDYSRYQAMAGWRWNF